MVDVRASPRDPPVVEEPNRRALAVLGKLRGGACFSVAALVSILLVGTTMAFGGAVGWARLAIAIVTALLVLAWLLRALLEGTWRVLRSPLIPLGILALLLGASQLAPMPSALAGRLSSQSRAVHALGAPPCRQRVRA